MTAERFSLLRRKLATIEPRRLMRWPVVVSVAAVVIGIVACLLFADPLVMAARKWLPAWWTGAAHIFNRFGNGYNVFVPLIVAIGLFAAAAKFRLDRSTRALIAIAAIRTIFVLESIGAACLISTLAKWVFGRVRPRLAKPHDFYWFTWSYDGVGLSFPSGHTTVAFSAAFALATLMPRLRIPLFAVAGLVGVSRIVLGAHYPSDVLGGALCGVMGAALISRAFARRRLGLIVTREGTILPKPWPRYGRFAALAGALLDKLRGRPPAPVEIQPAGPR